MGSWVEYVQTAGESIILSDIDVLCSLHTVCCLAQNCKVLSQALFQLSCLVTLDDIQ